MMQQIEKLATASITCGVLQADGVLETLPLPQTAVQFAHAGVEVIFVATAAALAVKAAAMAFGHFMKPKSERFQSEVAGWLRGLNSNDKLRLGLRLIAGSGPAAPIQQAPSAAPTPVASPAAPIQAPTPTSPAVPAQTPLASTDRGGKPPSRGQQLQLGSISVDAVLGAMGVTA